MSRIFLSLHPFYESGPIMGRKQANAGFINALFRKDPFDLYHFYVDQPNRLVQRWQEEPDAQPLLARGALHAFPRTYLEKRLSIVPYTVCHLSDPMSEFAAMCRVRNAIAPKLFPITAVNHTISYTDYAESTLGHVWAGCSPRDAIGCTSAASRLIMQAWYDHARQARQIPPHWQHPKLALIPLGVPNPQLGDDATLRKTFRDAMSLSPETALILIYGRISVADKMDVRPFFSALRRIRQKYPERVFHCIIAGATDDDATVKEQLDALAKTWDIPFTLIGHPSRETKKQLFAAADIFASPVDNIQETFGLTLVEAAQSALPVIASHWDGYKDIVVHGETGLLVPTLAPIDTPVLDTMAGVFFNKIHQILRAQQTAIDVPQLEKALFTLISDATLRQKMGRKAQERAAKLYTFDTVIDQWVAYWQELENTPISAEQEAELRAAVHPYTLRYGEVFSVYATQQLQDDMMLCLTDLGQACLEKKTPWNNYALVAVNLQESLIHKLLAHIKESCTVHQLLAVAKEQPWGKRFSEEVLLAHVYWLVKQDLVEYSASAETVCCNTLK